ncbi:MAG: hypothetical protein JWP75_925 [Frondihabitans sp.]|nr:hypothetical protein [Frondihabitans sp.]
MTGYGWTGFTAVMTQMEWQSDPPTLTMVAIPVGMFVSIAAIIAWVAVVMKRPEYGLAYGTAGLLAGAGIGVLAARDKFQDPGLVVFVGVGLLCLGAAFIVLGGLAAMSRARAASRQEAARRTGTLTTATVSDRGYTIFRESTRILTTVTFTFVDLGGVRRWVQRPMLIRAEDPLQNGQETQLWYDPARPGDDKSIVVAAAAASPWRGTR